MANARIGIGSSDALGALTLALAAVAAATAAAPSPAAAQAAAAACPPAGADRRIEFGSCRRSSIDAADPRNEEGTPYEEWRLRLARGQAVQIDMDAAAAAGGDDGEMADLVFDTYLELRRAGAADVVESNDDRPGSLNARIRYTSAQGGDYVVRARPLGGEQGGDYVLRVGAPPPPPPIEALAPGRVRGSIDARAPESETMPGHRTRHYAFQGTAGERVRIALASPAEGATMELGGAAAGETIASAGAEAEGAPATLIAILPETRRYLLQVHVPVAADASAALPFTLDFERRAAVPPREPRPVRTGETAEGEIGLASPDAPDPYSTGSGRVLTESYRLAVEAGRPVTVTVTASGFDPVLEAGDITALGFAAALSNDDYGDGLNSRLVLHPERSGTVVLRVRALGTGTGPFRIAIAPGAAAPLPGQDHDDHDAH